MNSKYAGFYGLVPRSMALILALSALVPFLAGLLYRAYGGRWLAATAVFFLASYALMALSPPPETRPAIEGEANKQLRQRQLPWSLIAYIFTTGLGYNWVCVFLCFSRRYAFFSAPVIGVTGLILALYAAIALLLARLTNLRIALGFAIAT